MKSKVVLLPCREYDEEKIYMLLKQGLDFLGGVETLIPKDAKILLKPNLLKKAEVVRLCEKPSAEDNLLLVTTGQ